MFDISNEILYNTAYIFLSFIMYSFLGYLCEVMYVGILTGKMTNRGFLYGPLVPIYAFGAFIVGFPIIITGMKINGTNISFFGEYFQREFLYSNLWMIAVFFVIGFLLTSCLEYFTSWAMEKLFKIRLWDYSKRFLNINGRVCLRNSTLFGIMIVIMMYIVGPIVEHIMIVTLNHEPFGLILFYVIIILFIIDLSISLSHHISIAKLISAMEKAKKEAEEGIEAAKQKLENIASSAKNMSKLAKERAKYPTMVIKSKAFELKLSVTEYIAKMQKYIHKEK